MKKLLAVIFMTGGLWVCMALINRADAADWQYMGYTHFDNHPVRYYLDFSSIKTVILFKDKFKFVDMEITEGKPPYTPLGEHGQFIWKLDINCTYREVSAMLINSVYFPGGEQVMLVPPNSHLERQAMKLCH